MLRDRAMPLHSLLIVDREGSLLVARYFAGDKFAGAADAGGSDAERAAWEGKVAEATRELWKISFSEDQVEAIG